MAFHKESSEGNTFIFQRRRSSAANITAFTHPVNNSHKDSPSSQEGKIALSLVREYLAAAGLSETLTLFKKESQEKLPELSVDSISSRADLAKALGITKLVKVNKESAQPVKTFLEVMVAHSVSQASLGASSLSTSSAATGEKSRKSSIPTLPSPSELSPTTYQSSVASPASSVKLTSELRSSLLQNVGKMRLTDDTPPQPTKESPKNVQKQPQLAADLMVYENVDDEDFTVGSTAKRNTTGGRSTLGSPISGAIPITSTQSIALRTLLFGGLPGNMGKASFSEEWKGKGFALQDTIPYGLIQKEGGPCGVLAAVQAMLLKHLLFPENAAAAASYSRNTSSFSSDQCKSALIEALTESIWRARGNARSVTLVLLDSSVQMKSTESRYQPDGFTENMVLCEISDVNGLKSKIALHISQFTQNTGPTHGLIQYVYSLILTRGVEKVKQDMDEPETTLIGKHNYCTQELVHLCLLGEAISNVFDGNIELKDNADSKDFKVLKGIRTQSEIGHLSLFEHYNSLKVGDNFKIPMYPIYVIISESHYTVLFSKTKMPEINASEIKSDVDVYFYDQLANQQEEIRLTLSGKSMSAGGKPKGKELISPIEHCIRTKWHNVTVNWNGTEPLL